MIVSKTLTHRISLYLLLISTLLYFSQGVLIAEETYGPVFLFVIFGISFIYLFKVLQSKELFKGLSKVWFLFLIVNVFFYIFTAHSNIERNTSILKIVLLNFLPFFPFLYFSKINLLSRNVLILFFVLALSIFIVKFRISLFELQYSRNKDWVVDNTIYLFIGLLPFAFLFKRKSLIFIFLIIIWYFMVLSSKRAAIVSGLFAILLFIYQIIYVSKDKYKLASIIVAVVLGLFITYLAYHFYIENEYLVSRIELMLEGDSSNRDILVVNHFNRWYNSNNLIVYLFGFGYNSSQMFQANVAHNDWIDMLGSFGIFGLILYITLWYYMIRELFVGDWNKNKKIIMILFLGLSFIASLFFRWYNSPFPFMNFIILPYLITTKEKSI